MTQPPALIPELAVSDWHVSRRFYCDMLGFSVLYERPEEGFAMLAIGTAQLMIDQIGAGRTFDNGYLPQSAPFGRGVNLQIEVPHVGPTHERLLQAQYPMVIALEDKWYRRGDHDTGHRQCVVADPDGYLIRLFQTLGTRPNLGR